MVFIKRPPPLINISTSGEPRKGLSPTKQRDDDDDEEREDRSKWKTITLTELHTALKKGKRPWIIILNHPVYPDAIPTQLSLLCPRGGGVCQDATWSSRSHFESPFLETQPDCQMSMFLY